MATLLKTVAEYLAERPFPADDIIITDTAENILTLADQFDQLGANGVFSIDATNDALSLSLEQISALGAVQLTLDDVVTLSDTSAHLSFPSVEDIQALPLGVDAINSTDNELPVFYSVAAFNELGGIALTQDDTFVLRDTGGNLAALTPVEIAALAAKQIDALDASNNVLALTLDQYNSLGTVELTTDDSVTLSGTVAQWTALFATDIASLSTNGVDVINVIDGPFTVNLTQLNALNAVFASGNAITLSDTGAALGGLSPTAITALADVGIDVLDASDGALTLDVQQFTALGSVALDQNDTVTLSDTGANIATLSPTELAALAGQGVDILDVTDAQLTLSVAQLNALSAFALNPADTITLSDAGAALAALTPAEIGELAGKGIDTLDASDNALALSLAQFNALGSLALNASDAVTVSESGATFAALTPAQIAALAGKAVDFLDASDGAFNFSLSQFNALGSVALNASDVFTLSDTGGALAAQIGTLAARGVDAVDATDGLLSLSSAQYASFGLPLVAGDTLQVNGTASSERITGRASNDILKGAGGKDVLSGGAGDDKIFGGTGNDTLKGDAGNDVFVFDTKLSKKTNLDKISDYNVKDDSLYLDNAIFKSLGKGSAAAPGHLKSAFFRVGDHALDRNDHLIYNKKTGVLYYDSDGSGAKAAVEVAVLKKGLKMSYHDFFVI